MKKNLIAVVILATLATSSQAADVASVLNEHIDVASFAHACSNVQPMDLRMQSNTEEISLTCKAMDGGYVIFNSQKNNSVVQIHLTPKMDNEKINDIAKSFKPPAMLDQLAKADSDSCLAKVADGKFGDVQKIEFDSKNVEATCTGKPTTPFKSAMQGLGSFFTKQSQ